MSRCLVICFLHRRWGLSPSHGPIAGSSFGADELSQTLQRLLPELHPVHGTYSIFEERGERARAESACIGMLALVAKRYDIYTHAQASGKLLQLQWEQLQEIVSWTDPNNEHVHAVLVLLAVRGLGKSKALISQVPEQEQNPEKAVLYLMDDQAHVVPSVEQLSIAALMSLNLVLQNVTMEDVFSGSRRPM